VSDPSCVSLPPALRDAAVALLTELCAISSPSGDGDGLRRAAACLAGALEARGLAVTVEQAEGDGETQPVLVGRGPDAGDGGLLLVGHLDTVLPAAPPLRVGERLVATGALDMKGGLTTLVAALDLLAARGVAPPADLVVVAVPDEEVGGPISREAMRAWGARARAALVLEPGAPAAGGETLVAGRRGLVELTLDASGRAAHSGIAYRDGRSALAAAAAWCAAAQALSRPDQGETVNVGRLIAGDADFVDNLAACHDLLGTGRRLNVVPARARAEGEARFSTRVQGEGLAARLAALAREIGEEHGVELNLAIGGWIDPVDPSGPGGALAAHAVALAARRGWRLEVERERGGISLPNFLARPTLPVLDGLGPVGGGMHTREEYIDLGSLERRIILLADLLDELRSEVGREELRRRSRQRRPDGS